MKTFDTESKFVGKRLVIPADKSGQVTMTNRNERDINVMLQYHPDPTINDNVAEEVLRAEVLDLAAGLPPRRWTCECGRSHSRGHVGSIGVHRCLYCGYIGEGGVMWDPAHETAP